MNPGADEFPVRTFPSNLPVQTDGKVRRESHLDGKHVLNSNLSVPKFIFRRVLTDEFPVPNRIRLMTGINSAVTGEFSDPPVIMTGITPRFISRPDYAHAFMLIWEILKSRTSEMRFPAF
jgi:hypothetical protein